MNVPVDWPETVTVSTRDLVATMRFVDLIGFHRVRDDIPKSGQPTIDAACRAYHLLAAVLDAKCPGWE